MNRTIRGVFAGVLGLSISAAFSARATPVTVQELGVAPYEIVSISVPGFYIGGGILAGVNKLLVDGLPKDAFCIDPFHWSKSGPQSYNLVPLTDAPKDDHLLSGTHMTGAEAATICKLWALAYPQIGTDAQKAAGLQIAIWEVVGGSYFHLTSANDYGASQLLSTVGAVNYSGPSANLMAVTGPGQDFVIDHVPEGGATLTLFGLSLFGLATAGLVKDKIRFSRSVE